MVGRESPLPRSCRAKSLTYEHMFDTFVSRPNRCSVGCMGSPKRPSESRCSVQPHRNVSHPADTVGPEAEVFPGMPGRSKHITG